MRVYSPQPEQLSLPRDVQQLLDTVRLERGFAAQTYLEEKCRLINGYLQSSSLTAVVVGLSGGIDSALVVAMLAHAKQLPNSPITRIVAAPMPVHDIGATGQSSALARAQEVIAHYGVEAAPADLTDACSKLIMTLEEGLGQTAQPWARGQIAAYLRTPALYGLTSLLTEAGSPALVAGTTNRDEGAYLGYVGKASDGMVDLQLISDLHKSEVFALATYLNVPQSVLDITPAGDMYDGRVDTQVFGAPYDFVELYLSMLCWPAARRIQALEELDGDSRKLYQQFAANLERLHSYNAHKYSVGSPAVHLDILPTNVPGGWNR